MLAFAVLALLCSIYDTADGYSDILVPSTGLLSNSSGFYINGALTNDQFASSFATGADLNGDGDDDFLMGSAYSSYSGRSQCGAVYLIYGRGAGGMFDAIDLRNFTYGVDGITVFGAAAGDMIGYSVAFGDINMDGSSDIIIGAPYALSVNMRSGAVYVIYNSIHLLAGSTALDLSLVSTASLPGIKIMGQNGGDLLGWSVALSIDLSTAGTTIYIGAPAAQSGKGAVYIIVVDILLPDVLPVAELAFRSVGYAIYGANAGDQTGLAVCAADFDGDGVFDIVIGSPNVTSAAGRYSGGVVDVIYQSNDANPGYADVVITDIALTRRVRYLGTAGSRTGQSLSRGGIGTLTPFPVGDILVGAPDASPAGRVQAGAAYLLYSNATAPVGTIDLQSLSAQSGLVFRGASAGDKLGCAVSGGEDLSGDSVPDILLGACDASASPLSTPRAGIAYVLLGGSLLGSTDLATFQSGARGFRVLGQTVDGRLGSAMAVAGDLNGDGRGDYYISMPGANPPQRVAAGSVFGIYGASPAPSAAPTAAPTTAPTAGPTAVPSAAPSTAGPTAAPTVRPTVAPTANPTKAPSIGPSAVPTLPPSSHRDIDLLGLPTAKGFQLLGGKANDRMGYSVSRAGDVNHDGVDDFIVGAYDAEIASDSSRLSAGVSYVVFGSTNPSQMTTINGTFLTSLGRGFRIFGRNNSDQAGSDVGAAGDVNGDGIDDFMVAASLADPPGASQGGIVYVIFGRAQVQPPSDIDLTSFKAGPLGFRVIASQPSEQIGRSLAYADVNGDGLSDLILGAYSYLAPGKSNCGAVYIVFGSSTFPDDIKLSTFVSATSRGYRIVGAASSDRLGNAVGAVGDWNGDGKEDFVIGSYGAVANGRPQAGVAYVLFGGAPTPVTDLALTVPVTSGFRILGAGPIYRTGYSLSGIGDFNGDSLPDLLIGAPNATYLGRAGGGAAYVIYGSRPSGLSYADVDLAVLAPSVGFPIYGYSATTNQYTTGYSVAGGGDVNGDGRADIIVGAPYVTPLAGRPSAGIVYVIFGQAVLIPSIDLFTFSSSSTVGFRILGMYNGDAIGVSLANAGDINHDGLADILIGIPDLDIVLGSSTAYTSRGSAFLVYGTASAPSSAPTPSPSAAPSVVPTNPTARPTATPTAPTPVPTTASPTTTPTPSPSREPSLAPTIHGDIDLASFPFDANAGFVINGAAATDASGSWLGQMGDINNDGKQDFGILAPAADPLSRSNAGILYVLFGGSLRNGTAVDLQSFPTRFTAAGLGFRVYGVSISLALKAGTTVLGGADLNDDGLSDMVIAAPGAVVVWVVFGKTAISPVTDIDLLSLLPSNAGYMIVGPVGSAFGSFVAVRPRSAGFRDSELIVGAPGVAGPNVQSAVGAVYVLNATALLSQPVLNITAGFTAGPLGYRIIGSSAGDQLGIAGAVVPDLNDDGRPEVVVVAPYADSALLVDCGIVYVVFSKPGGAAAVDVMLSVFTAGSAGYRVLGGVAGGRLGQSLDGSGDYNGNGRADLLLGAPLGADGGSAYVIHDMQYGQVMSDIDLAALSPTVGQKIAGPLMSQYAGMKVGSVGDVNHDGIDDFFVGVLGAVYAGRPNCGMGFIVFGHTQSVATIDLTAWVSGSAQGIRLIGGAAGNNLGRTVSPVGDINNDGTADFAVSSASAAAASRPSAGVTYIVYGSTAAPTASPTLLPTATPSAKPTYNPTTVPTTLPTVTPSATPTCSPTASPTCAPTVAPTAPTFYKDVDLVSPLPVSRGYAVLGSNPNEQSGGALSTAGDLNGDGVDDYLVASNTAMRGRGVVHVIYGTAGYARSALSLGNFQAGPETGFKVIGPPLAACGFAVSGGADVNGDSVPDVLVGCPGTQAPFSNVTVGAVFIILGNRSQPAVDVNLTASTAGVVSIYGEYPDSTFGLAAALAADINGDGVADVVIGAKQVNYFGRANAGVVYVLYGSPAWLPGYTVDCSSLTSAAGYKIYGDINFFLGQAVSGLGDVNGDGYNDFAISAVSGSFLNRVSNGAVIVLFGSNTGQGDLDLGGHLVTPNQGFTIFGSAGAESLGRRVSSAGDFNNDGLADFLVTSTTVATSEGVGVIYVIFGSVAVSDVDLLVDLQGRGFRITGSSGIGVGVSRAGDLNGDGVDDIVVGSYSAAPAGRATAGMAYVIFGRTGAPSSFPSISLSAMTSGPQGFRILGAPQGARYGYTIANAGDVNGDGLDDLLIGSKPLISSAASAGVTQVLYGVIPAPTSQPTSQPSRQPSAQPTRKPTSQPSRQPTRQPTSQPCRQPTSQPSQLPSQQPSSQPSRQPTMRPSVQPTGQPSCVPTTRPSRQPSSQPTCQPSTQPTQQPAGAPTAQPSRQPSGQPSTRPSVQPNADPTAQPSASPTCEPSRTPTSQPSTAPSRQPSASPSHQPSSHPSGLPTTQPSVSPTCLPSNAPSHQPSSQPSAAPSSSPTAVPTLQPTGQPTVAPSRQPSSTPTAVPSAQPSTVPTYQPIASPSSQPSSAPTTTPSSVPTALPSYQPLAEPTGVPTSHPSTAPSHQPTSTPSSAPSAQPTTAPTAAPSAPPSARPSSIPSAKPTTQPTAVPTAQPSTGPTARPSYQPSAIPSVGPTVAPSTQPSSRPSSHPSAQPSTRPTARPSGQPSTHPTGSPTGVPSTAPSGTPTSRPSDSASGKPSSVPTHEPTPVPTAAPTVPPTPAPSAAPSCPPTRKPSVTPTARPTIAPTQLPTVAVGKTATPSRAPTVTPTLSEEQVWRSELQRVIVAAAQLRTSTEVHRSVYYELDISTATPSAAVGSCSSWRSVLTADVESSLIFYKPASIQLLSDAVLGTFQAVRCADPAAVYSIVRALVDATVSTGTINCDDHVWVVQRCGLTKVPAICVDCSDPCAADAHCSSGEGTGSANPFTLAPCIATQCPHDGRVATAIRHLTVSFSAIEPAPRFLSLSTASTKTSLAVTATLSAPGSMYCAAYVLDPNAESPPAPSSTSAVLLQNFVDSTDASNVTALTIGGLPSATDFLVYCVTVSRSGSMQSLQDVLAQPLAASTACCIPITVQTTAATVAEGKTTENFLQMAVNALPAADITVSVEVQDSFGNKLPVPLFPATFKIGRLQDSAASFGMTSVTTGTNPLTRTQSVQMVFSLLPLPVGVYTYTVTVTGASVLQYSVEYADPQRTITVLNALAPLPAPQLLFATFADDGSHVLINFDSNTDKGSGSTQFACSALFSFACADKSSCVWSSSKKVQAFVTADEGCAAVNSSLSLSSVAVVKALCTATPCDTRLWPPASTQQAVTIAQSANSLAPTVVITAPSAVGSCDMLMLDLSASSGNGGRPWLSRSITVETLATANVTDLHWFLSNTYKDSPPTPIPAALLSKGYAYNFIVKLCNFMGKCSQGSKRVLVQDKTVPTVTLPGAQLRSVRRSDALVISSDAYITACAAGKSRGGLSYSWEISLNGVPQAVPSLSKDPSRLRLPAYSLQVGSLYDISLKVTIAATLQSSTSAVQVYVAPGSVVAVVQQGLSRTVQVQQRLTIDGSSSYDEDQQGVTGLSARLQYSWSCVQTAPTYATDCDSLFASVGTNEQSPVFTAVAGASAAGYTAKVTLYVLDEAAARSATSVVAVTVVPSLAPVVTLTSSASNGVINQNRELQLSAEVALPLGMNGTAVWSVDDTGNFDFAHAVLSPTVVTLTASRSSAAQVLPVYLVLRANSLPDRAKLTFSLTVALWQLDLYTTATVAVTANYPPQPGTFTVSPSNGTEIIDPFTFVAAQWYDADLPLQYQFGYVANSGAEVILRSKSETSYGTVVLTAGPAALNYSVTCTVQVFDSLSARNTASRSVTVRKQPTRYSADVTMIVTGALSAAADNVDDMRQAIALSAYILNEVNCSAAPSCATLHRKECYRTPQTCGECISDAYVGDTGDSNLPCVPIYANFTSSEVGKTCSKTADCSAFERCGDADICERVAKECRENCNFPHGVCQPVDISTGDPVGECYAGDPTCRAVCLCAPLYAGSATCGVNSTELAARRALRTGVARSLQRLVNAEDADQQTVSGWVTSINSVAQAPDQLSTEGVAAVLNTVATMFSVAQQTEISVDTASTALQALGSILGDQSRRAAERQRWQSDPDILQLLDPPMNATGTVSTVSAIVDEYKALVINSLLPGQDAVTVVLPQFRVLVQKLSALGQEGNVSISAPQTALEALRSNVSFSSITLPDGALNSDRSKALTVSLGSTRSDLFNSDLSLSGPGRIFSDAVSVQLSGMQCTTDSCRYDLVLPVAAAMNSYRAQEPTKEVHNTTCGVGDFTSREYVCADGSIVHAQCEGTSAIVTSRCPVTIYVPACNAVVGGSVNSSGCTVKSATATSIVCSCPVQRGSSGRRLQGSDDDAAASDAPAETSVSYVAMLSEVKDNFVNTVVSAQGLDASTLQKSWSVLVTVGLLGAAIVCGLYWSHHADAHMDKVQPEMKGKEVAPTTKQSTRPIVPTGLSKLMAFFSRGGGAKARVKAAPRNAVVSKDVLFAEKALPGILSSNSLTNRVKDEMKHHHKWFGVVFYYSRSFPRVLRVLSLATNVVIMLFIQSITYALTNPDDGTCEALRSEQACLQPPSPYATGESKCHWDPATTKCGLVQPDSNVKVILFVAIFSALLATPLALLVDYIIMFVLSAPTKRSTITPALARIAPEAVNIRSRSRLQSGDVVPVAEEVMPVEVTSPGAEAAASRSARKRSSLSRSIFGSMFGTVFGATDEGTAAAQTASLRAQADLRNLVAGVVEYRATLSAEQRVEFDGKSFVQFPTWFVLYELTSRFVALS
jgi:hypothetical protein